MRLVGVLPAHCREPSIVLGRLLEQTNWEYWESRLNKKCQNCKMHSVVEEAMNTWKGKLELTMWSLSK